MWPGLRSNLLRRGKEPAANHLSRGTAVWKRCYFSNERNYTKITSVIYYRFIYDVIKECLSGSKRTSNNTIIVLLF
jgi:hypothetical protein